jgi:hypothetical protein
MRSAPGARSKRQSVIAQVNHADLVRFEINTAQDEAPRVLQDIWTSEQSNHADVLRFTLQ